MQILNLIDKTKGNVDYEIINFPDGEPHIVIKQLDRKDIVDVLCRIANPHDLFIVMQVGDILNRQEIPFSLLITYLMGMRMDRVISFNEAFSLKIVANAINSIHPEYVRIIEAHSEKAFQLIKNSEGTTFRLSQIDEDVICFPDAGAVARCRVPICKTTLTCSKKRDPDTGKLSGFEILNPQVYQGGSICVVDDLCDGGGTFAGIASEIRKIAPDAKLNIYVTHMVNPRGIAVLSENYDHVTFTDSYFNWLNMELPDNVTCKPVIEYCDDLK